MVEGKEDQGLSRDLSHTHNAARIASDLAGQQRGVSGARRVFSFRLTENQDPEERLEEAALWKALHDVYSGQIIAVTDGEADYGRPRRFGGGHTERASVELAYWNDNAFLRHAGRRFWVGPWERAEEQVEALHADGLGAFIKSTRAKHWICKVPVGQSLLDVADAMAFSFIDGGPQVMVQELAEIRYEHRFFVIDRRIVTHSPNAVHLTPLDHPQTYDFETPQDDKPSMFVAGGLLSAIAEDIAGTMVTPDAVIDCALINGKPGCVEINPMVVGGVGLFACDVRALARAIYARDTASLTNEPASAGHAAQVVGEDSREEQPSSGRALLKEKGNG